MNRHWVVLGLVGAAHLFGCTTVSGDSNDNINGDNGAVTLSGQPLADAVPSSRSDVVGIVTQRGIDEQLCTGSLLLPNLVLTARHCLTVERAAMADGSCATAVVTDPDPATKVTVIPGTDIDLVAADAQRVVTEYLLADDEAHLCGQDLALLLLDQPIAAGVLVTPARAVPAAGSHFSAVGYGLFDGDWGRQRQRADARITCVGAACGDARIVDGELLANSGACEGDSGGPALDSAGALFAVVSRSAADCSETAYLTLDPYFDWLKSGATYAAALGGFGVPAWASAPSSADAGVPNGTATEDTRDIRARGGCSLTTATPPGSPRRTPRTTTLGLWALGSLFWLRQRRSRMGRRVKGGAFGSGKSRVAQ